MSDTVELKSECLVYTFKEGLLSRVAHDLKLTLQAHRFVWCPRDETLTGRFQTDSLRVVCARVEGQDAPGTLSARDKEKIEETLRSEVLRTVRFPEARLNGTLRVERPSASFDGEFTLCGVTRPLKAKATLDPTGGGTWTLWWDLHQPSFGIKPYRAALGALKVQPDVRVCVQVEDPRP